MRDALRELTEALPKGSVLTDPESLIAYGYDGGTLITGRPEAVVMARSESDVVAALRVAARQRIPVFPRGAGSGLAGGAVPKGGVVVNLAAMNRILSIDEESLMAVVEPGVVTADFQAEVERRGLFYPPDPASLKQSTLGGNVATGAGGPRCLKYGTTREYVRGLRVVLPGGEVVSDGGAYLKSAVGYNLSQLVVGSEGTLGVVTQITLRLIPKPPCTGTVQAWFTRLEDAAAMVTRVLAAGILPSVTEFMDRMALEAVSEARPLPIPAEAGAMLLIECDGHPAAVDAELGRVVELCRAGGALSAERAVDEDERERLWTVRRSISGALSLLAPAKLGEDISLPRRSVVAMVRRIEEIAARHEVRIVTFGHLGDGNLHPNFVFDPRDQALMRRVEAAAMELVHAAVEMGGTLSGEHGIGLLKCDALPMAVADANLALYARIKAAFDPDGIMNPGKVLSLAGHDPGAPN